MEETLSNLFLYLLNYGALLRLWSLIPLDIKPF